MGRRCQNAAATTTVEAILIKRRYQVISLVLHKEVNEKPIAIDEALSLYLAKLLFLKLLFLIN